VIEFNHTISKPGEVRLNELLNMTIGKVEVGNDLAKMIDMKPIYFDLGKSKIRPDAARELDKVVAIMKEIPGMTIELGAHTDCRSAAPANLKLSTARAKASATYIASKGVPRERITGKGFGESKLLNGCACEGKLTSTCTEEDHAMNRRTEFIITKLK
jgi:outer membrane protein OmpA-like peptidoglycan-associated protein